MISYDAKLTNIVYSTKKRKKEGHFQPLLCLSGMLLWNPSFLSRRLLSGPFQKRPQQNVCYRQAANTGLRLIRGRERREENEKVKGDESKKEPEDLKICTTWGLTVMKKRVYSSADMKKHPIEMNICSGLLHSDPFPVCRRYNGACRTNWDFVTAAIQKCNIFFAIWPPGYAGPRNLPSTGFFPFLQTLMCTSDSNCHSTPRSKYPATPQRSRARSAR